MLNLVVAKIHLIIHSLKHCLEFIPNSYKIWAKKNVLINNLRIGLTNTKIHKKKICQKINFLKENTTGANAKNGLNKKSSKFYFKYNG